MLIYITGYVQFSVFSCGHHQMTLQTAIAMKELGHEVRIVNILDNGTKWYEDCPDLANDFTVLQKREARGADLLIDVIGCLTGKERSNMAAHSVLFVRCPPTFNEIERTTYGSPALKRNYDGINEIWTYDIFGPNDYEALQLLGRCPIRTLPFFWSPKIIDSFTKSASIPPWFVAANQFPDAGIKLHIAETNQSVRSSCTLPLVMAREFDKQNPKILSEIIVSNASQLLERPFFKDNVFAHIDTEVKPELVGRSRCCDWIRKPLPLILSHVRFTPIRFLHLDVAWMGIPIVHNAPLLRDLGEELSEFYYDGNSISGAVACMKKCYDKIRARDYFTERCLLRTRYLIVHGLTVMRDGCKEKWNDATATIMGATFKTDELAAIPIPDVLLQKPMSSVAAMPVAMATSTINSSSNSNSNSNNNKTFRMQFVGMWDQFQPDYNFFTLLMQSYFGSSERVVGCGPEYVGDDINVRILGPFGSPSPVRGGIPVVFTTGENIPPISAELCERDNIKLQLGFAPRNDVTYKRLPLWMMSINWFDADNDRLVNPKVMPLAACTSRHSKSVKDRSKFCAFIVSNPNNPVRNNAFEIINSKVGYVDSAGRYRNNCGNAIFAGLGGGGGELAKVKFLEDYRYNITYENGYGEGYVTEKLFHAKVAGCIPIYWGDSKAAAVDFDAGGFIDATNMSEEQLVARLKWLESAEGMEERERIAATPLFNGNKAASIRSYLMDVAKSISEVALRVDIKPVEKTISRQYYGRNY